MLRFMWRKREFYRLFWRCFDRVKCGRVVLGSVVIAAKVIYCVIYRKCWQTNLSMCGWARVTRILCVKHKNSSWVSGDFVLESLFCAQRLWILNLFSADTELWAWRFDWLKDYNFWTSQNPVTSARELYRLLRTIMLAVIDLSLFSLN